LNDWGIEHPALTFTSVKIVSKLQKKATQKTQGKKTNSNMLEVGLKTHSPTNNVASSAHAKYTRCINRKLKLLQGIFASHPAENIRSLLPFVKPL